MPLGRTPSLPRPIAGLSEIAEHYDALIVDLWGVMHDGVRAFPEAVAALVNWRASGRPVCLLSNVPRRIDYLIKRLDGLGVPPQAYDSLVCSGEATFLGLRDRPDATHRALGSRFLHFGGPADLDVVAGLPLERVEEADRADFVLNSGIDGLDRPTDMYDVAMDRAAERGLPMVCVNPDLVVLVGGRALVCAGELARRYEALGGRVIYHGKPHAPVFDRCLDLLGGPARALMIGDSLRTDIAGADAMGLDSLWVATGIHADAMIDPATGALDPTGIAALLQAAPASPTWVAPRLSWLEPVT